MFSQKTSFSHQFADGPEEGSCSLLELGPDRHGARKSSTAGGKSRSWPDHEKPPELESSWYPDRNTSACSASPLPKPTSRSEGLNTDGSKESVAIGKRMSEERRRTVSFGLLERAMIGMTHSSNQVMTILQVAATATLRSWTRALGIAPTRVRAAELLAS